VIKNVLITGDTHGRVVERIHNIRRDCPDYEPNETAIIILGDAGINYYLNKSDKKNKANINALGYHIYCVRGNHEERPENVPGMHSNYDKLVQGMIYSEPEYPFIKYFQDGHIYKIKNYRCLVIGGAYSVDKYWRLQQAAAQGSSFSGWFEGELLTQEEMDRIYNNVKDKEVDFIFSHTCPSSIEPTDLFLDCIDQTTVDKSMEEFLKKIRDDVNHEIWCFGHFHADRVERPGVEQFYYRYEEIDTLWHRWFGPGYEEGDYKTLNKSPFMDLYCAYLLDESITE
jgi:3-oxoacid CoA-transferase subunit A